MIIIRSLLQTGRADFEGSYHQVRECELLPRGPRPLGLPIMIGTNRSGPRMLRLTAQYADIWNCLMGFGRNSAPSEIPPLRAAVDAACEKFGRSPDTLERTASVGAALLGHQLMYGPRNLTAWALSGSPEELESAFRQFAQEGISHVQVFLAPCTPSGIEAFAPVLELLDSA